MTAPTSSRMLALDYLRGYFIIVIIIDHLWRWPSALSAITGQGELWVTAAEGFIIISGFLIGYVRGFKGLKSSISTVTSKLLKRALLLYIWLLITSLLYTAAIWYLPTAGSMPWTPYMVGDWLGLITGILSFQYAQVWIYFLYLYTIFLALSPLFVYLLRRGMAWMVGLISLFSLWAGNVFAIEWLQWLPLFFIPSIAGYYLPTIQMIWKKQSARLRRTTLATLYSITAVTLIVSVVCTFIIPDQSIAMMLNSWFIKEPMTLWRMILSFVWFVSLVLLFERFLPTIHKYVGKILEPFGSRSLSAYVVHGVVLCIAALWIADSTSLLLNTSIGFAAVAATWGLLRLKVVQKYAPR